MKYSNAMAPTPETIQQLIETANEGPIYMVNLLKFKENAEYNDGREASLTGREAYALYSAGVGETISDVGGTIVFAGEVSDIHVGEVEDLWDDVAIVMYPNKAAMLQMFSSTEYQEIHAHREAGLAGQLNIETRVDRGIFEETA
jgi:uncharacterized protein (DUF1330 family)